MRVCVIGAGAVGLVSGLGLAQLGHRVVCADIDRSRVEQLNAGRCPIHEAGLPELLRRHLGRGFSATADVAGAVRAARMSIIAVGTPCRNGAIDLSAVEAACAHIGEVLRHQAEFHTVVVRSTVVPGTTEQRLRPILESRAGKRAGEGFGLAVNPEFLREGSAVHDFLHPDRIVMGACDPRSLEMLEELYRPFAEVARVRTRPRTAEMIKYASNAFLATLISFSNEIANLCAALGGVDASEVMAGLRLDKRLSPMLASGERLVPPVAEYLEAGCGFGGSCFPKDLAALSAHARQAGCPLELLEAVLRVNERQPRQMIRMLEGHFPRLAGLRVGVLGLAFKPGTDDVRDSPALAIIRELLARGAAVAAYDPVAVPAARALLGERGIVYCDRLEAALDGVDAVMVVTRWEEFGRLPQLLAAAGAPPPLVIDGRRMLARDSVARYAGIGLGGEA